MIVKYSKKSRFSEEKEKRGYWGSGEEETKREREDMMCRYSQSVCRKLGRRTHSHRDGADEMQRAANQIVNFGSSR
jgi:hypothetical protein